MRRRRLALTLCALASSAAACQVVWTYDDFKDKPATTSTHSGSSSSGGGGSASSSSSSSGSSGSSSSSSSGSSSSSSSSSGGCVDAGHPCDCDGDGDNAATPECDYDGGDCNDHDPRVNSKQTGWFYDAGPNDWDYNCDNKVDFQYTGPINCPIAIPCPTDPMYVDTPPPCGQSAVYQVCKQMGLGCVKSTDQGLLLQGCH